MLKRKGSVLACGIDSNGAGSTNLNRSNSTNRLSSVGNFGHTGVQSGFSAQYSRAVTHPRRSIHDGFTRHVRS